LEEAAAFLEVLDEKVKEKILYNVWKSRMISDKDLFKKLEDDIWEFRTLYNKTYYRLFAFWDKTQATDTLVVSTHGIVKKSKKINKDEIIKATRIREQYFKEKI
jgi:phage-related protein